MPDGNLTPRFGGGSHPDRFEGLLFRVNGRRADKMLFAADRRIGQRMGVARRVVYEMGSAVAEIRPLRPTIPFHHRFYFSRQR